MEQEMEHRLLAKTFAGLEDVLYEEIIALGGKDVKKISKGVSFVGDNRVLYMIHIWSRVALRVFKQIDTFEIKNEDQLYHYLRRVKWDDWMNKESSYAVDVVMSPDIADSLKYATVAAKDAIFNFYKEKYKFKLPVDAKKPELRVNLHFFDNKCDFMIDATGESLYKRGYRVNMPSAPLNECLAAGMILMSGWKGDSNFIDPMCGSGTLLIEAAMIAKNIPPRLLREEYLCKNWNDFDASLWAELFNDSRAQTSDFPYFVYGSDVSNKVLGLCKENILVSGLRDVIRIKQCPFEIYDPPKDGGAIFIDPPAMEKLRSKDKAEFFKMMGDTLKRKCRGMSVWIIVPDIPEVKSMGITPILRNKIFNGNLECNFLKFEF